MKLTLISCLFFYFSLKMTTSESRNGSGNIRRTEDENFIGTKPSLSSSTNTENNENILKKER